MKLHIAEVFKRIADAEAELDKKMTKSKEELLKISNRITRAERDCYQTINDIHNEVKKHGVQ